MSRYMHNKNVLVQNRYSTNVGFLPSQRIELFQIIMEGNFIGMGATVNLIPISVHVLTVALCHP